LKIKNPKKSQKIKQKNQKSLKKYHKTPQKNSWVGLVLKILGFCQSCFKGILKAVNE